MCALALCLWLGPARCVRQRRPPSGIEFFTNSWAVEVEGGRAVADDVARRRGFINLGQVRATLVPRDQLTKNFLSLLLPPGRQHQRHLPLRPRLLPVSLQALSGRAASLTDSRP